MTKSPKQRFNDFVVRKNFSEIPAIPMIVGDHAAFISDVPLNQVCKSGKKLAEVLIHSYEIYQHDLIIVFSDVSVEAESLGTQLEFPENASPFIIGYPELSTITPNNPAKDGRMPEILEATERCVQQIGKDVQICVGIKDPFSLAGQLRESNLFYKDFLKNPMQNKKLLEIATENQISFIKEILKLGIFPFIGAPFSSGSLISPKLFREFVAPYLKRLFDLIKQANFPVLLHICGDSEIIVDEIVKLQPDVTSVDQLDLVKNSARFYDQTLFMGNLSTTLLLNENPKNVTIETERLIHTVKFPFLPSTGCDVPMQTPNENVKAMIKAVKNSNKIFKIEHG